jgi:hypothetical protein
MKIIKKINHFLRKLIKWYTNPISGRPILRVDPFTVILTIGLITTLSGMGAGLSAQVTGHMIADSLREASVKMNQAITDSYDANRISAYQRDVSLERLSRLTPIFNQYADIIEAQGNEIAFDAMAQTLFEVIMTLNPATHFGARVLGKLPYAAEAGFTIDNIISVACITNTIDSSPEFFKPFSEEESELRDEIEKVLGLDADALFKARMRAKINYLKREWKDTITISPCPSQAVIDDYYNWAYERAKLWGEGLYGEGEKWATYDDFVNWLVNEAKSGAEENLIKSWSGNFESEMKATADCRACLPTWISGQIDLYVNLETCSVEGEITGEGEGPAVNSDCGSSANPCSGSGSFDFFGYITGSANPSGTLTLDPTPYIGNATVTWGNGCDVAPGTYSGSWEDELILTGTIDWEGVISGEILLPTAEGCEATGSFTLLPQTADE